MSVPIQKNISILRLGLIYHLIIKRLKLVEYSRKYIKCRLYTTEKLLSHYHVSNVFK